MSSKNLSDEVWSRLREELRSWIGTKYIPLQKSKNVGADCCTYIGKSLESIGVLSNCEYPSRRDSHWYLAENNSPDLILEAFNSNFERFMNREYVYESLGNWEQYIRGDMLLFKFKKKIPLFTHCGVYMGNDIILHNKEKGSISEVQFSDKWKKYCKRVFRLYER